MQLDNLTKEQWANWREHPMTEHFFDVLKIKREQLLELLAYGSLESEKKQDNVVGRIAGLTDVLNTTFEGDE